MFLEEKLIINAFFSTSQNKKQNETQSLKKNSVIFLDGSDKALTYSQMFGIEY